MEKSVESGESLFKVLSFVSVYFLIVYSRRHSNLIFSRYIFVSLVLFYIFVIMIYVTCMSCILHIVCTQVNYEHHELETLLSFICSSIYSREVSFIHMNCTLARRIIARSNWPAILVSSKYQLPGPLTSTRSHDFAYSLENFARCARAIKIRRINFICVLTISPVNYEDAKSSITNPRSVSQSA